MRVSEAFKYLGSGVVVYVVMAACSDEATHRARQLADAGRDGASTPTGEAGGPRGRDGGRKTDGGWRGEGGLLEAGLLDRFIRPVTDAVAQQACATCSGGAFRVLTADTDPGQRVKGTVSLAATAVATPGADAFAWAKVADGPLFVTDAKSAYESDGKSFGYYVVGKDETCGMNAGDPDDGAGIVTGFRVHGGHYVGDEITFNALRSAQIFVLSDEKICAVQQANYSGSMPAATLTWSGYKPYGDG